MHAVDGGRVAEEVGRQHLDGGAGPLADGEDAAAEVVGPAVGQVVARHRGDDDVLAGRAAPPPRRRARARRLPASSVSPRGTEQKPHGRVQTLPRIMNVAVRRE